MLPTLVITGLLTSARLVRDMAEDTLGLMRIQRIRAWYHRQFAGEHEFFADAVTSGGMQATWS
ncbi:hypothetical protein [Micromonospora narathiwatensis]|uniref:hypothetical protein n=1 Tax=Micromonospora narathiwatensis TaxID=299146 RepID=UPI0012FE2EAA|nr:hypothetical protein [Micromonospora narathiwatensis]